MRPMGSSETSVMDYHSTLRDIPEERRSHLHRSWKTEIAQQENRWAHFCKFRIREFSLMEFQTEHEILNCNLKKETCRLIAFWIKVMKGKQFWNWDWTFCCLFFYNILVWHKLKILIFHCSQNWTIHFTSMCMPCVISGYSRGLHEFLSLLGCYTS
jgi:hypothetical protein